MLFRSSSGEVSAVIRTMFEAPFQALPGTLGLHERSARSGFAVNPVRTGEPLSGPGRYKSHNPIFKAQVALAKGFDSAIVPTILLKCCARNLNDSFMFWAGVRVIDQEDAGVE